MDNSNESLQWSVSFIRASQDCEVGDITDFFSLLYSLNINSDGEDRLLWIHLGNMNFSDRSLYKVMSNHPPIYFPWKIIWKSKCFSRLFSLAGWLLTVKVSLLPS